MPFNTRTLIKEYQLSLRELNRLKEKYTGKKNRTEKEDVDLQLIGSMISDMQFAIQWLQTGRNPDMRRGVDKTGVYLTDPRVLDSLRVDSPAPAEKELSREEKELIEDALCTLTVREKDVFMLIKVEGITYEYAAELLGVKKSTVQKHLERAVRKIEQRKNESLFLVS